MREELVVAQPKCLEIYYDTCAAIDQHNRHRQDTLCIKRKIETKIWDKRVKTYLFGMYVVDVWLIYTGAKIDTLQDEPELVQQEFYCASTEEVLERVIPTRSRGGVNCAQKNIQKHQQS